MKLRYCLMYKDGTHKFLDAFDVTQGIPVCKVDDTVAGVVCGPASPDDLENLKDGATKQ